MGLATNSDSARVIGRYVLFGEIASGGMATVHFGRLSGPVGFSRTVAIKRLHPQFAKDPEFVRMFLDEARLAGRIRHPNVVPTLDVVATEGEIFLVMEYVQGESLSRLVRALRGTGERMPPDVCVSIVAGALHGLHAAHEAKDEDGRPLEIVHRDVSPQNVLVGVDGVARVLDFGVAKAAGRLQTTREGQIKGKVSYMAPEQLHGGGVARQTDIYAAAVVLWEVLTGRRLFEGDNEAMVLIKALEGKVTPPSRVVFDLSAAFDDVIARGVARDPALRFQTARDMAIALEKCWRMASPSEVGAWVERIAGEELHKRAAQIAEVESSSARLSLSEEAASLVSRLGEPHVPPSGFPAVPATTRVMDAPASPAGALTDAESGLSTLSVSRSDDLPVRPRRRWRLPVVAAVTLASALAAGAVAMALRDMRAPAAVSSAGLAATSEPPAPPPIDTVPQMPPMAEPPDGHDTRRSAPAPGPSRAATPAPPSPAPPLVSPPRRGAPRNPAPVSPAKDCEPPFTIDSLGHKKYKLECMTK
jgi:eukaryotic-like serine/threonine-protein kinase